MAVLHFWGANRQVTGSRYCLETPSGKILIDCGLFQEREFQDRNSFAARTRLIRNHGFSGHADRRGLLKWVQAFEHPPRQLFLTHGEEQAALSLAQTIGDELGWSVSVPEYREAVELTTG